MSLRCTLLTLAISLVCLVPTFGQRQQFLPGPSFTPDAVLSGSSLAGWHTLGQAKWQLKNGNLNGDAGPSGSGGWLVMDHSFQDVALFTKFLCATGCDAGILFAIQKLPDGGMKGTYASLSDGSSVKYFEVTTDSSGKIMERAPLASGGGKMRVAAPRTPVQPRQSAPRTPNPYSPYGLTPGVTYPYSKPDTDLYSAQWNDLELIFDANILRGDQNNGRESGGITESSAGYGPIAFYVGGKGGIQLKQVAYKDLSMHYREAEYTAPEFSPANP